MRPPKRFKIVTPVFVYRWGYPLTFDYIYRKLIDEKAEDKILPHIYRCFKELKLENLEYGRSILAPNLINNQLGKAIHDFLKTAAYMLGLDQRWGGPERKLYTLAMPDYKGLEFDSYGYKIAVTGEYVSAWGCRGYDDYDGDYCPAYLENAKRHTLYSVPWNAQPATMQPTDDVVLNQRIANKEWCMPLWIEKTNVEIVK